jgi:hypothetical protein
MGCIGCIISILLSFLGSAPAAGRSASNPEGCVAVPERSCSYVATRSGGYEAVGNAWRVQIVRQGQVIVYTPGTPAMQPGVIQAGDRVSASTALRVRAFTPSAVAGSVRMGPGFGG